MTVSNTALLLLDVQAGNVERYGSPELADRLAKAAGEARSAGIPVLHVALAFRTGFPEVASRNKMFSRVATSGRYSPEDPGGVIHEAVGPEKGDVIVRKRRVSGFTGSDLEVVLRARGVRSLVLAGIATSGVVLSTLREAADKDFDLTVLSDGCADPDPEVHRVLLAKVFPSQADVLSTDSWVSAIAAAR